MKGAHMADTPISWPPIEKRRLIGKRTTRLDGPVKSRGKAKYCLRHQAAGDAVRRVLTCPHAHARVTSIDTSAAEKSPGVKAVELLVSRAKRSSGRATRSRRWRPRPRSWPATPLRKIKVEYEVLPHLVDEQDLSKAGSRAKPGGEQVTGDPDKAFKEADVISEGTTASRCSTHCSLETHGQVIEWKGDSRVLALDPGRLGHRRRPGEGPGNPRHQRSRAPGHIGGGFGSKFRPTAGARARACRRRAAAGR